MSEDLRGRAVHDEVTEAQTRLRFVCDAFDAEGGEDRLVASLCEDIEALRQRTFRILKCKERDALASFIPSEHNAPRVAGGTPTSHQADVGNGGAT